MIAAVLSVPVSVPSSDTFAIEEPGIVTVTTVDVTFDVEFDATVVDAVVVVNVIDAGAVTAVIVVVAVAEVLVVGGSCGNVAAVVGGNVMVGIVAIVAGEELALALAHTTQCTLYQVGAEHGRSMTRPERHSLMPGTH
jgi:hypothetical protein